MNIADMLKGASFVKGLSDEQLEKLVKHGEKRSHPEGELVFDERSTGDEVFILLDGRVQISVMLDQHTDQAPIHTVVPGKVFGEFALVADHKRSASARAVADSVFFVLSRHTLHTLAEEDPNLGYVVLKNLSEVLVERIIKTTKELRISLMF